MGRVQQALIARRKQARGLRFARTDFHGLETRSDGLEKPRAKPQEGPPRIRLRYLPNGSETAA